MRYAPRAEPAAPTADYREFLERKFDFTKTLGFDLDVSDINPLLKPHQRDIVQWAVKRGRSAIFAAFGLGKTFMQLETLRIILRNNGKGRALIVAPLGVKQEFRIDGEKLGIPVTFIRSIDAAAADGIYITNYETIRDGKLDPRLFDCCSLDEASVLRGFGGTKTFREFMRLFDGVRFKFVATATPSPNQYIELLAYSAFLEVMDVGQAKTRFFKRNSEKADDLTIHPHKEREFWLWLNTWAIFVQRPSDLGYSDAGYQLPPIDVRWHEVRSDHSNAGIEKDGQLRLLKNTAFGLSEAAREKRDSLDLRVEQMLEIVRASPDDHFLLWHDLEHERAAIKEALPQVSEVYGSLDLDEREQRIADFSFGKTKYLATKPVLSGSGCNFQRFCHRSIFVGIGFKFNDFIQAIHRIQRFLQPHPVRIDIIFSEAERDVRRALENKWARHTEMVNKMSEIIKTYGLSDLHMREVLKRSIGCERIEVASKRHRLINNDCVEELRTMDGDSVDLIVTSIPFATQYEYTPSYNDFGHTDSNEHFWQQMDFLIPNLMRVLRPGRVACIHTKDRITPGGINGFGFQTVQPFSDECIQRFVKHGFAFLARKTIVTDVVRENNQTYRLGWTEQCKDGSRMGAGMPEYALIFRKPPTDRSDGYADVPVVKNKAQYSRSRWQQDAHGFTRSSGNRVLTAEELSGLPQDAIFQMFKKYSLGCVYDFEHHVKISESIEATGWLPTTFMLLQPASWHDEVWTDVTRMMTLNSQQSSNGKEMHLCPLQFDIVDRLITQFSNPDDTVLDPFGGLMTVPYRALHLGRKGIGIELNATYFLDGVAYCEAMERKIAMPTLFDAIEAEQAEKAA